MQLYTTCLHSIIVLTFSYLLFFFSPEYYLSTMCSNTGYTNEDKGGKGLGMTHILIRLRILARSGLEIIFWYALALHCFLFWHVMMRGGSDLLLPFMTSEPGVCLLTTIIRVGQLALEEPEKIHSAKTLTM